MLSEPDDDVFGLASGVEARYASPFSHPMHAVGSIFFAPDILTLSDAGHILDLNLRHEVQVVSNLVGFFGYLLGDGSADETAGHSNGTFICRQLREVHPSAYLVSASSGHDEPGPILSASMAVRRWCSDFRLNDRYATPSRA